MDSNITNYYVAITIISIFFLKIAAPKFPKKIDVFFFEFQVFSCSTQAQIPPNGNSLEFWQSERPKDMANIVDLEVMCGKQHMEVTVSFDKPFNGIIFSKVRIKFSDGSGTPNQLKKWI